MLQTLFTLVLAGAGVAAWGSRYYWFEKNFREVVPGQVYAGAYQNPMPLRQVLRKYRIKTVLSLLSEDSSADETERRVVAEAGMQFRRVPIPRTDSERGKHDTVEQFLAARLRLVEEAVKILADPQSQPVFVHCEFGKHRTGAVVAIYRVKHCGWTEWTARDELKRWGGFDAHVWWPSLALHDVSAKHVHSAETQADRPILGGD